jgi:hypothetical protein
MTNDDIVDALLRQKQQIEEHLPELLSRCPSDAESAALKNAYGQATQQWNNAVNRALRTNNPALGKLVGDLGALQDEIAGMIARADDFGAILNRITTGIMIGSKILMAAK